MNRIVHQLRQMPSSCPASSGSRRGCFRRVGKGASAPRPPSSNNDAPGWWARFRLRLLKLRRTWSLCPPYELCASLLLHRDLPRHEVDDELAILLITLRHIRISGGELAEGLRRLRKALAAGDADGLGIGVARVHRYRGLARARGELRELEILFALLAGHDIGAVGVDRILRGEDHVKRHSNVLASALREHDLRYPRLEQALARMAGEADQDILPRVLRQRDALVGAHARLKIPEDSGAANLFEHHRAAVVGGMRLAAALVVGDQQRVA